MCSTACAVCAVNVPLCPTLGEGEKAATCNADEGC